MVRFVIFVDYLFNCFSAESGNNRLAGLSRAFSDLFSQASFWPWAAEHVQKCTSSGCKIRFGSLCRGGERPTQVNSSWPWPCLKALLVAQCAVEPLTIGEKKFPPYFKVAAAFAAWLESHSWRAVRSPLSSCFEQTRIDACWLWFWAPANVRLLCAD